MTRIMTGVVLTFLTAALGVGGSGLLLAGGTKADVDALKAAQPEVEQRLGAVEMELAGLKGAVETRAEADKEYRVRLDKSLDKLDGKLDRLIEGDY